MLWRLRPGGRGSLDRDRIIVRGARVHNLKNVDVDIPKNCIVVVTGVSGSGKSSLAFDTIYAEGYRRYVESLSSYARQFLEVLEKPDVDFIYGLTPSIAIDQKSVSKNPRSTVATVTEIYDYLRLLFARVGEVVCPNCNIPVQGLSVQEMVDAILSYPEGTKAMILAPVVRGRKGEHRDLLDYLRREGFARVRVDGRVFRLDEPIDLEKNRRHDIEVVVDRIKISPSERVRIADSVELALKLSGGIVVLWTPEGERLFSESFSCPYCGFSIGELDPKLFSFNSPYGACPVCKGLGYDEVVDPEMAIIEDLSIAEGAVIPANYSRFYKRLLMALCDLVGIPKDVPFRDLSDEHKRIIIEGYGEPVPMVYRDIRGRVKRELFRYDGIKRMLRSLSLEENLENMKVKVPCAECGGSRLRREALAVKVAGKNIWDVVRMTVKEAYDFFNGVSFGGSKAVVADKILREIKSRLGFLVEVGLDYITLDREASTLSGGEAQRIRLATQIGSTLSGVTYVLDEPTVGLHPKDTARLVENLKKLRDLGNTVIVVEHDQLVIEKADYVVDLGPGGGQKGGEIVYAGPVEGLKRCENSLTGLYLAGKLSVGRAKRRDYKKRPKLVFRGVRHRNLKNIDVEIPLGCFVCITGVSGSGKSSLLMEVIYPALHNRLNRTRLHVGAYDGLEGWENVDRVVCVDQSPIGRTPRSNPATYVGFFTQIRELFASTPEARARGYRPGRFSFNVKGGRCEKCQGEGYIKVEMLFLPDVYVKCDLCKGTRYNRETLEILYKGKNIADVLNMTVDEACEFFENIPSLKSKLELLRDVGLGYIKLGQPATTLSGGEAQRIKLARELTKRSSGRTVYILDEPTVGLHMDDVDKLVKILQRLVDKGNTVIVIEHNMDVIKNADYIIDLGPEGGDRGGYIVAKGSPEEVAQSSESYTGKFLREVVGVAVDKGSLLE